jgi:hypothetical protein
MIYTFSMLERLGRLGNQLWQVASTIGLADQAGGQAVFRSNWEYRPFFNVPDSYFGRIPRHAADRPHEYLQELRYWDHIREHILEIFSISPNLEVALEKRWSQISNGGPTTCIHVRRGDYLKYPDAHPVCSPRYYNNGIEAALEVEPATQFIVFSDDPDYCEHTLFRDSGFTFVRGVVRPIELVERKRSAPEDYWDLQLMAKCDQHIISNSSFAWWGATLADNKRAFYPSVWYGKDNAYIDWKSMIPKTWIEVEC